MRCFQIRHGIQTGFHRINIIACPHQRARQMLPHDVIVFCKQNADRMAV